MLGVAVSVASASSDDNKVLNNDCVGVGVGVDGGLLRARVRVGAASVVEVGVEVGGSTLSYGYEMLGGGGS